MDTATQNLENDHVYILRLIDVMEKMTHSSDVSVNDMETVVSLIKDYADGFHHAKEENLLFPLMAKRGFSKEQGPVAVMLHEHVQGRNYVKGMVEGITALKEGNQAALTAIYENMRGYILLLRSHIGKENNVLFRMADKALSEDDQKDLLEEFAILEKNGICGSELTDCIATIQSLEKIYNH